MLLVVNVSGYSSKSNPRSKSSSDMDSVGMEDSDEEQLDDVSDIESDVVAVDDELDDSESEFSKGSKVTGCNTN